MTVRDWPPGYLQHLTKSPILDANLQRTKEEDGDEESQSIDDVAGRTIWAFLHVVFIAEIISLPVTDTELPLLLVTHLVLN